MSETIEDNATKLLFASSLVECLLTALLGRRPVPFHPPGTPVLMDYSDASTQQQLACNIKPAAFGGAATKLPGNGTALTGDSPFRNGRSKTDKQFLCGFA